MSQVNSRKSSVKSKKIDVNFWFVLKSFLSRTFAKPKGENIISWFQFNIIHYFDTMYDYLNVNILLTRLSSVIINITILLHTASAILFMGACPKGICRSDGWVISKSTTFKDEIVAKKKKKIKFKLSKTRWRSKLLQLLHVQRLLRLVDFVFHRLRWGVAEVALGRHINHCNNVTGEIRYVSFRRKCFFDYKQRNFHFGSLQLPNKRIQSNVWM